MTKQLLTTIAQLILIPSLLFAQTGKVFDNLSLPSKILKSERKYAVYLPPDYEASQRSYPILYLLHGAGDDQTGWVQFGEVLSIADKSIKDGTATPMIIVMPYGNVEARIAEQKGGIKPADVMARESTDAMARMRNFAEDMTKNIIPYVDKTYRTIPNRENRAIGGFSRGGGQTLRTAFWHMDTFAWICCYSAYLPPAEMESTYQSLVADPGNTNKQLKLLWVSVGNEDFLYNDVAIFLNYLTSKKIKYKSLITGGGHTWMNVKTYLAETAPLLFK